MNIKRILVPTDFSRKAQFAANFAFDLAATFNSEVTLIHRKSTSNSLSDCKAKMTAIHGGSHSDKSYMQIIEDGDLFDILQKKIGSESIDLVVMGSQGQTEDKKLSMGSIAQKAVRLLDKPVIIVKKPIDVSSIDSIIFASNFNTEARTAFETVLVFARQLQADIHLVTIDAPVFFHVPRVITRQSMKAFKDMAGDLNCYMHDISGISVESGVSEFAGEVGADLVAIGTYGKKAARIFSGSVAEALVGSLDIPVMTINIKN